MFSDQEMHRIPLIQKTQITRIFLIGTMQGRLIFTNTILRQSSSNVFGISEGNSITF